MSNLRLVFAGTPEFAARHLSGLLEAGMAPVAVYTQPDRPAGRGKKLTPSPVKLMAESAGITVLQPESLRGEQAQAELKALAPDLLIVVAYGLILPQAVLDIPTYGCINVHASLLPRWRGAAPIQRAIEAGDSETGVTLMRMEAGLDTGPMLAKAVVPIGPDTSAAELHDSLADCGVPLLLEVLSALPEYLSKAQSQDDGLATYASKIDKREAKLDWQRDATSLARQVRAFNPFPVCWTELGSQRLKVWRAQPTRGTGSPGEIIDAGEHGLLVACGEGALLITTLQLPGGKALPVAELLRSRRELLTPGTVLGS